MNDNDNDNDNNNDNDNDNDNAHLSSMNNDRPSSHVVDATVPQTDQLVHLQGIKCGDQGLYCLCLCVLIFICRFLSFAIDG